MSFEQFRAPQPERSPAEKKLQELLQQKQELELAVSDSTAENSAEDTTRLEELERRIRAAQLEVPGGLEFMTAEAIGAKHLADRASLERMAYSLKGLIQPQDMRKTVGEVIREAIGSELFAYPIEVQHAATKEIISRAVETITDERRDVIETALPSLIEQIDTYFGIQKEMGEHLDQPEYDVEAEALRQGRERFHDVGNQPIGGETA